MQLNSHSAENETALQLPKPVAIYLAAEKAKNVDMLDRCFAEDALVHDEGRDYHGLAAIKTWKHEADLKYRYIAQPLNASVSETTVKLCVRLIGDFPGSPVELDFIFTLANDKITSLVIQ
jgi:hypothetical protein